MNLFWQINLLVCVSAVLVYLAEKLVILPHRAALRFVQGLFILSILAPMALKLIPSHSLRGVESKTFTVYADRMVAPLSLAAPPTSDLPTTPAPVTNATAELEVDFSQLALGAWALGVLFFLVRFGRDYVRMQRLVSSAVLIKGHGRSRIVAAETVSVPFSVKLFSGNWVVLPAQLLSNKTDLDLAIKHELQHHRQGDTAWAMLLEVVGCFLFFNPAVYLWKNIFTELQELSCDESLTGQRGFSAQDYGSCLLRVAEAALEHRQMYAGTTSMAAIIRDSNYFRAFLMRRIQMITERTSHKKPWTVLAAATCTLLLTVATAIGAEKIVRGSTSINPGDVRVDKDVQKIADDVLSRALVRMNATAGFIIVAEPATGKILAVANKDKKHKRQGYWILGEQMELGSIMKPVMVAEAFEAKKTTLTSKHNCENGKFTYNGTEYKDWKVGGWKTLTTSETIELSSNICSLKIAQLLGEEKTNGLLAKFGFGADGSTHAFPAARPSVLPEPGTDALPRVAMGLGFKSSPLEIMQAYGAIANGGTLMEAVGADEESKSMRRVLSKSSIEQLRQLLRNSVLNGTGVRAQSDIYTTAGKTSTVDNRAGFIGFAPLDNPKIAVYVGIIDPHTDSTGAHGGAHAAPVFKETVENVLTHLKVASDKI